MHETIHQIVEKVFGERPVLIEEIAGKGIVNLVFKIVLKTDTHILRMQKGLWALELYKKEQWCAEAAAKTGIPTPAYGAVGTEGEYSYSFQEYVEGTHGAELPDEQERIWRTLGAYAAKFNTIPAPEYKVDFDLVEKKIFESALFGADGIFSDEIRDGMKKRLDEAKTWNFEPMLCHANLHPSNVVVSTDGLVHLIDWGTAAGHRAPHAELAELYTWNNGKQNICFFLEGYGLDVEEVSPMMRDIQTLVLARLVNSIRWKIKKDEDWKTHEYVESMGATMNVIKDFDVDILFSKNLI